MTRKTVYYRPRLRQVPTVVQRIASRPNRPPSPKRFRCSGKYRLTGGCPRGSKHEHRTFLDERGTANCSGRSPRLATGTGCSAGAPGGSRAWPSRAWAGTSAGGSTVLTAGGSTVLTAGGSTVLTAGGSTVLTAGGGRRSSFLTSRRNPPNGRGFRDSGESHEDNSK